jgi:hypothetical protein
MNIDIYKKRMILNFKTLLHFSKSLSFPIAFETYLTDITKRNEIERIKYMQKTNTNE